jgi:hypothetical protein
MCELIGKELKKEVGRIVDYIKSAEIMQIKFQPILRQYVADKSFPLEERFEVWSQYCKKEEYGCIIHKGEFGWIGGMVDDCWPDYYERYREYDWEFFLDAMQDDYYREDKNCPQITVDEFKEMLIETNFGSFINDW